MSISNQDQIPSTNTPVEIAIRRGKSPEERFWAKVDKTENCWLWLAAKDQDGYGLFWPESKKTWRAHQYSYFLKTGEKSTHEQQIHHLCYNKSCVNPEHLILVSAWENIDLNHGKYCDKGKHLRNENLYINRKTGHAAGCKECNKEMSRERRNRNPEG